MKKQRENTEILKEKTARIRVFGIVQGVGFRPTVSRHAMKNGVRGSVCNMGPYVEILAQGDPECVRQFCEDVKNLPPERAAILKMDVEDLEEETRCFSAFEIIESGKIKGDIFVSPDIAICPKCKKEMYDPDDRRYLHPFINCTCCGPRLTILDAMPYDRERTSMAEFPMCEKCAYEYNSPTTRRYDAQPVCCNDCGPEVYVLGRQEKGPEAIRYIRQVIKDGGIVAIKGIGGFHLCCDAAKEETVRKLRERKNRPRKPFAVMMKDMETVRRECRAEKPQETVLDGHQKPILLLEKREGGKVCESVAPGNPKIGVMLPYAPIQLLLFDYKDEVTLSDCLVMTSANTSGAPICRDDEDAERELSGLCDAILSHNRLIRIRADDTVMDFYQGKPYMIRRSRGYAPLPFMLKETMVGEVLAVGGELKNTFCIGKNQLFYPSPYIGDMGDVRTVHALKESAARMEELLEVKPKLIACDLHPGYNTTAAAEEMAQSKGIALMKIQHHYAHILSCMAENDWDAPVLGVSFDGTGYGTDGTIWGGEFLVADYDSFHRWGSIEPFLQTGGDLSAKEGWRIAVSLLREIYGEEKAGKLAAKLCLCGENMAKVQCKMAAHNINSVISTSAGRLFDAVSAVLGICGRSTFEGEASTSLEFAAWRYEKEQKRNPLCEKAKTAFYESAKTASYESAETKQKEERLTHTKKAAKREGVSEPLLLQKEGRYQIPTHRLFRKVTEGRLAGKDTGELSYFFHKELAEMIVCACREMRRETGIKTVALSGGVYQNQLLLKFSVELLEREGFHVLTHHLIPPNDGGICLGQAVAAMKRIQKE